MFAVGMRENADRPAYFTDWYRTNNLMQGNQLEYLPTCSTAMHMAMGTNRFRWAVGSKPLTIKKLDEWYL